MTRTINLPGMTRLVDRKIEQTSVRAWEGDGV
jgi:hypothetical protein